MDFDFTTQVVNSLLRLKKFVHFNGSQNYNLPNAIWFIKTALVYPSEVLAVTCWKI